MDRMQFDEHKRKSLVSFLLRVGVSVVFLYAGISSLSNPQDWIGFVPQWISIFVAKETFLFMHGITDLLIGVWLLSNFKSFWAGLIASLGLIAIISVNFTQLEIIFRDVAILFASLAIMALNYKEK